MQQASESDVMPSDDALRRVEEWLEHQKATHAADLLDEGDCTICLRPAGEGHCPTDSCGIVVSLLAAVEGVKTEQRGREQANARNGEIDLEARGVMRERDYARGQAEGARAEKEMKMSNALYRITASEDGTWLHLHGPGPQGKQAGICLEHTIREGDMCSGALAEVHQALLALVQQQAKAGD